MPTKALPTKALRVLCFGDSLTSGFYGFGLGSHPYATRLTARLKAAFPELEKIYVVPNGVPGDEVLHPGWMTRLEKAGMFDQRFSSILS